MIPPLRKSGGASQMLRFTKWWRHIAFAAAVLALGIASAINSRPGLLSDGPQLEHPKITDRMVQSTNYSTGQTDGRPDLETTPVIFGSPAANSTIKSDDGITADPTRIGRRE